HVPVGPLERTHAVAALGHRIGANGVGRPVVGVDLLPERLPAERARRLALLLRRKAGGQDRIGEPRGARIARVVLLGELCCEALALEPRSGVDPRLDARGWEAQLVADGAVERLGVRLLHEGEPAELALVAVEIPVAITKARDLCRSGDAIDAIDALD